MKPICVPCQRFYRMKKSGYYFIEGMPKHNGAPAGKSHADQWKPYKLWSGDLWECKGCGAQIISGCGIRPVIEHFQPEFDQTVRNLNAKQFQVNDC